MSRRLTPASSRWVAQEWGSVWTEACWWIPLSLRASLNAPGPRLVGMGVMAVARWMRPRPCIQPPSGLVSWWPGDQALLLEEPFDSIDPVKWTTFGSGTVQIQAGKLFVQSATSGPTQNTGLATTQTFSGDFDIEVEFSEFLHDIPGDLRNFGALTLNIYSVLTPALNSINLERRSGGGAGDQQIFSDFVFNGAHSFATTPYFPTFGQLRFRRIASTVTLSFRTSEGADYVSLLQAAWVTDPVRIALLARNDNFGGRVSGKFDNARVSPTVTDIADANHGTLQNGATFAAGMVNQAPSLDGVDDYVTFGDTIGNFGTSDFTIDFWIKTNSTRLEGILGKRPVCMHSSFWDIRIGFPSSGLLVIELDQDAAATNYNNFTSTTTVNDGNFHHIVVVRTPIQARGCSR
jgi:hypothetical protein